MTAARAIRPTQLRRWHLVLAALIVVCPQPGGAQVTVHPRQVTPAAWERYTLSVVNGTNEAIVAVRVDVPDAITILGVSPTNDWTYEVRTATDTTPQSIEWSGGAVQYPALGEFAFLGRVAGDAREKTLVFPVRVTNAQDAVSDYNGRPGSAGPAPTVAIVGRAIVSVRGAVALSGAAIGLAALALAMSVLRGQKTSGQSNPRR